MEEALEKLALEAVEPSADQSKSNDSFDVIDYVRELFLNSEEQKKLEKKKIRLMRICASLMGIVALVVVVGAVVLVPMLLTTISEANKTLVSVQQVDIQAITQNIDTLAVQATETLESAGEAVKVINDLDMQSLNATIAELKVGVESFSKIDFETLNTAIANFNATIEPFANFFGKK